VVASRTACCIGSGLVFSLSQDNLAAKQEVNVMKSHATVLTLVGATPMGGLVSASSLAPMFFLCSIASA
jgi:hypothetical protein